jgi:type I restriction enzyme R subunit
LEYVLDQYVSQGVEELETDKLSKLIALKYNSSLADGIEDLGGDVDQIRSMFIEFQAHLYAPAEAI